MTRLGNQKCFLCYHPVVCKNIDSFRKFRKYRIISKFFQYRYFRYLFKKYVIAEHLSKLLLPGVASPNFEGGEFKTSSAPDYRVSEPQLRLCSTMVYSESGRWRLTLITSKGAVAEIQQEGQYVDRCCHGEWSRDRAFVNAFVKL